MKRSSLLAYSFFAAALVACGGAESAAPKAPSSVDQPSTVQEPQTIEEAQAQLERARASLSGTNAGAGAVATPGATPTQPPSSSTAAPPTVSPQVPQAGAGAQPTTTCDSVCRAVTSMHHAMDAICRLAGPADARCTDAKKKVADGDAQAASCSCPMH